jgi:hypothetical protein
MAGEKKVYDVQKGLVNGRQVNTLDSSLLIEAVRERTAELTKDCRCVYVLHDPCDIRKPSAPQMEHIGKVLSLSKQVVHGYRTFNSVAVDVSQQGISLLGHTLYSTEMPNYVSRKQLDDLASCPKGIRDLVAAGGHVNTGILYVRHIREGSRALKEGNPGVSVCHVSDREFDCADFFEEIDRQGDSFITRMKLSRLSNEARAVLTPTGRVSKKASYKKLADKDFANRGEYVIDRLDLKGKVYPNVRCVLEWEELDINGKGYSAVRIALWNGNKPMFEHPMLLLTNKPVLSAEQAKAVYKAYLLRFKIEVVFKFLKQNLGWESFQIRDFESIKNLLAVSFFLVGYFKELEEELRNHPLAAFLCQLACSKGKVTIFFLLEGLAKLVHFQEVRRWKQENNISDHEIDELIRLLKE